MLKGITRLHWVEDKGRLLDATRGLARRVRGEPGDRAQMRAGEVPCPRSRKVTEAPGTHQLFGNTASGVPCCSEC